MGEKKAGCLAISQRIFTLGLDGEDRSSSILFWKKARMLSGGGRKAGMRSGEGEEGCMCWILPCRHIEHI